MPELSQEKLQEIARAYFRELLIGGNDKIFWIEEMWNNSPEDRAEILAYAENREAHLRQLNQQRLAGQIFSETVDRKLIQNGIENVTPSSDSHAVLRDYFVRAEIESSRILQAKLKQDYSGIASTDPLYLGIMDDTLPPMPEFGLDAPDAVKTLAELVKKFKDARKNSWEYKSGLDFTRVLGWLMEYMGTNRPIQTIATTDICSDKCLASNATAVSRR